MFATKIENVTSLGRNFLHIDRNVLWTCN